MKPSRSAVPPAKIKVRLKRAAPVAVGTPPAPYASKILPPAAAGALRIATWNINSVRLRLGLVKKLARRASPDVICLQETKTPDEHFPREALAALGYVHQGRAG